jgi:hypothetical protein
MDKKNCFLILQPWIPQILQAIKKVIKKEEKKAKLIPFEELEVLYTQQLLEGNEELAEWVINAWVFKHADVYRHFAERLSRINPNFSELVLLTEEEADQVLEGAIDRFGATAVYLFSRLNGVVFSEGRLQQLERAAHAEMHQNKKNEEEKRAQESQEQIVARLISEKQRLQEKYEDKLAGVQRKYATDVEALKKQIRSLQKQLQHARC